jgi:general secretion pathway protein D
VPYLGNIPLIGLLFKTRNATSTKNNLILFIRPKILRDQAQAAFETDLKYNYMMDQQKGLKEPEALPLLPGVSRGKLDALPPAPPPGTGAPTPLGPGTSGPQATPAPRAAPSGTPVTPGVAAPEGAAASDATAPAPPAPPPQGKP